MFIIIIIVILYHVLLCCIIVYHSIGAVAPPELPPISFLDRAAITAGRAVAKATGTTL